MILTYNPNKNPLGKSEVICFDDVQIKTGNNDLPDAIKNHPDYAFYVEKGAFTVNDSMPTETKNTKKEKLESLINLTEK